MQIFNRIKENQQELIKKNSILLLGDDCSQKADLSKVLGAQENLPVFSYNILKETGSLQEIKETLKTIKQYKKETVSKLRNSKSCNLTSELNLINSAIEICKLQLNARKIMPKMPNFQQLGFQEGFDDYLKEIYGETASKVYRMQFEKRYLQAFLENLPAPLIIYMDNLSSILPTKSEIEQTIQIISNDNPNALTTIQYNIYPDDFYGPLNHIGQFTYLNEDKQTYSTTVNARDIIDNLSNKFYGNKEQII